MSKYIRYGFSDIVIESKHNLSKEVEVIDTNGNVVASAEIYFIEEQDNE